MRDANYSLKMAAKIWREKYTSFNARLSERCRRLTNLRYMGQLEQSTITTDQF